MARRWLMIALVVICLVYASAGVILFIFQRPLLFMNKKSDFSPESVGLTGIETHRLVASDGVGLVSWFAKEGPLVAIYFHGNGGALAWRAERIEQLRALGLSVLAIDYRGFGGSDGEPSEAGLERDADAAYDFARALGFPPDQIILYGESLGSGVAVSLAARRTVAAVILDSAYSSIADVAAARYWFFPVRPLIRDPFRSDLRIGKIKAPILMLHGSGDRVVPFWSGQRLASLAESDTTFVEVNGAGHLIFGNPDAMPQVRAWLKDKAGWRDESVAP